jgi:outer membrane protein assembly factor BamB
MLGIPAIIIHFWVLPALLAVLVAAAALVVLAVRARNRRWKMLLGLAAPLVILASCVGLFQIDHYHAPLVNVAAPAPASLSLILADTQTVYSLRARDGTVRWRHLFQGVLEPLAADNVVYVAEGKTEYTANALDALAASDGHRLWRHASNANVGFGTPLVLDGVVFVKSGVIYPRIFTNCPDDCEPPEAIDALNPRDGSVYWRCATPLASLQTPPGVADGQA